MPERPVGSTTVRRMVLGARLRRMREDRGITREEAGHLIRASESKLSRMELGRVALKERDVADLLVFYGVTDPEQRAEFLTSVSEANRRGWWRAFEDVIPAWFETYLGLEGAASAIRTYQGGYIPGLLQTQDYARAAVASAMPPPPETQIDRILELRTARQAILNAENAPHVWAIIDEVAFLRPMGDEEVSKGQIKHLLKLAAGTRVTLQILPLAAGLHPVLGGPFSILRFWDRQLPDLVYVDELVSALYIDRPEHVDRYVDIINRLSVESLTPSATVAYLTELLER